jgi:hypothetical protein
MTNSSGKSESEDLRYLSLFRIILNLGERHDHMSVIRKYKERISQLIINTRLFLKVNSQSLRHYKKNENFNNDRCGCCATDILKIFSSNITYRNKPVYPTIITACGDQIMLKILIFLHRKKRRIKKYIL